MLKKIALLGLVVSLVVVATPALANQFMQAAVQTGPIGDAAVGGFGGTVASRIYSVSGTETGINRNTAACLNIRCLRVYNTVNTFLQGGYISNQENTASYNTDADLQTFYAVWDAEFNPNSPNRVGYYAVQGQIANSGAFLPGRNGIVASQNCSGTATVNCFARADSANSDSTPLQFTTQTVGPNPNQIAAVGGLSPIPTVRVGRPGTDGCSPTEARLRWDDPADYAAAMKNGAPSPVQGFQLYRAEAADCGAGNVPQNAAYALMGPVMGPGSGTTGICAPVAAGTGCSYFAGKVVVKGPGIAPSTLETHFASANSQGLPNANATAVYISNINARYAGRGTVNVDFTTGTEAGVSGYYIVRSSSANGQYSQVSELITPKGDGSTYTYADKLRSAGRIVYYGVEVVGANGESTRTGAVPVALPGGQKKLSSD